MTETIKIGDKNVSFKASGATLFYYRDRFNRDLLEDLNKITSGEVSGESIMCLQRLAFTMAKQADKDIPDDITEWLDGFDVFPFQDVALPLINLWQRSTITIAESKNVPSRRKGK